LQYFYLSLFLGQIAGHVSSRNMSDGPLALDWCGLVGVGVEGVTPWGNKSYL